MATNPIFRYPLDPTGTSPDNKVVGETHTLPNRPVRALAPIYGMFFVESVVLTDTTTQQPLAPNQWRAVELQELPTARYGKAICAVILIEDQTVSNNISLTYQTLGGEYSSNTQALINMINALSTDTRPVPWPSILNRPDEFDPAQHFHDVGDTYGWEYIVHAINRLRQAILIGDEAAHDELRRYMDNLLVGLTDEVQVIKDNQNSHLTNTSNPHSTTKAQVGLSAVENFSIASQVDATTNAVSTDNRYMTPQRVYQAIQTHAALPGHTHTFASLTSKPTDLLGYGVTSVDVVGGINTATDVTVMTAGNLSKIRLTNNAISFTGTNGVVQGNISSTSLASTDNTGVLRYEAANHEFQGLIKANGDIAYYSSDERLKTNVRVIPKAVESVIAIGGSVYEWDTEICDLVGFTPENQTEHGFIAQRILPIVPDAVVPAPFNSNFYTVKYHRMVPLAFAAISELATSLDSALQRVKSLEMALAENKEKSALKS